MSVFDVQNCDCSDWRTFSSNKTNCKITTFFKNILIVYIVVIVVLEIIVYPIRIVTFLSR